MCRGRSGFILHSSGTLVYPTMCLQMRSKKVTIKVAYTPVSVACIACKNQSSLLLGFLVVRLTFKTFHDVRVS